MTGMSETRVRQISQGRQRVTSYEVLERIADGLSIPRPRLGLAARDSVPTDPVLPDAWADLLRILNARSNIDGCVGLRRAVEGQSALIRSARAVAVGANRLRLTRVAAQWVEFRSWIESNSDCPARADQLLDQAYALAVEADDQDLVAYVLMRKSQQALDVGDARRAVSLACRARQRGRSLPPRVVVLCLVREAEGHALADDASASRQCINEALRLVSGLDGMGDGLGDHVTPDYVQAVEARCHQLLGESTAALRTYEQVLAHCPPEGRLDEGLWRADLALAYLDDGEPQRAAEIGLSAVRVATATSSARALRAVGRLLPRLRRVRTLPAVPEFTDAYRAALGAVTIGP